MAPNSSLLNFFDQAYIINLPERFDRREGMQSELKMLGLSSLTDRVSFFPAIKPVDKGDFPSIGSRGCFLSHLEVLREAKNKGLGNVLIMEDDLSFTRLLIKEQDAVINELRHLDWDFAYLGHGESLAPRSEGIFQPHSEPLMLAHFLAINQRAIAPLVDFLEQILTRPYGDPEGGPMHVDGAYSTFRKQNPDMVTLIANPSLGFQRSSSSDIAGSKWFETAPVLAQVLNSARKVRTWHRRSFPA